MAIAQRIRQPAPVLGWDAKSALSEVQPGFGLRIDNMVPAAGVLSVRGGTKPHATGLGAPVDSVLPLFSGQTRDLLAFAGGSVFEVSNGGVPGTALATGLLSSRWRGVQYKGRILMTGDGADPAKTYDGATFTNTTLSSAESGTPLDPTSLINVASWKQRAIYVQGDTATAWVGGAGNVQGALEPFDLSALSPVGGNLLAVGAWSRDAAEASPDELVVFVFDSGALLIYQGADPDSWAIVGRYVISPPLGPDCLLKEAGDLLILTTQGYASVSALTQAGRDVPEVYLSDRISGEVARVAAINATRPGWQVVRHARGGLRIVNVPVTDTTAQQHVLSNTGAWCRWTGINARCWATLGDRLFFGADGAVWEADVGNTDNGQAIPWEVIDPYTFHGGSVLKRYIMARPALTSDGTTPISIGLATDFAQHTAGQPIAPPDIGDVFEWYGPWNLPFPGDVVSRIDWQVVAGLGSCASFRVAGLSRRATRYHGLELTLEPGRGL